MDAPTGGSKVTASRLRNTNFISTAMLNFKCWIALERHILKLHRVEPFILAISLEELLM